MSEARGQIEWVRVACPLCGSDDAEPIYERIHETGSILGRLRKIDVLCRRCGFMYTSPRPSPADMDRYYAGASGASGSVFHACEAGSRLHGLTLERARFMRPWIEGLLGETPGRLLDVGCGPGDLLAGLELPGWQKAGLEPSRTAARRARERGLAVIEAPIESAVLPPHGHEVISCISALEHVQDPRAVAWRLAEAVVPGGLVFVEVPDSTRPIAQVAEYYSFEHLSHFTRGSLIRCLAMAGLEVLAFDESPSIPNLRVCTRRVEGPAPSPPAGCDDRAELVAAIERYVAERERFEAGLTQRLAEHVGRWNERSARVAVYGAGMHTRFLMGLFELEDAVACVLDSDPAKSGSCFGRWRVHGPDEIDALELDAILISTQAFEQEVYDRLAPIARAQDIEVVRCYG